MRDGGARRGTPQPPPPDALSTLSNVTRARFVRSLPPRPLAPLAPSPPPTPPPCSSPPSPPPRHHYNITRCSGGHDGLRHHRHRDVSAMGTRPRLRRRDPRPRLHMHRLRLRYGQGRPRHLCSGCLEAGGACTPAHTPRCAYKRHRVACGLVLPGALPVIRAPEPRGLYGAASAPLQPPPPPCSWEASPTRHPASRL